MGFLGYKKTFIQHEAAFSSYERARKIARYYGRMYRPPYKITWTGLGGLKHIKIFDIVTLDGKAVVVNRLNNTIDAKENKWETQYEGEWIWPPLTNF